MKKDLARLLSHFLPTKCFRLVLSNPFRIGNFFNHKDKLPCALRSSVIYKFCCPQCGSSYVGSTMRTLGQRIAEHRGVSYRTNRILTQPSHSAIRDHAFTCDARVHPSNFNIIGSAFNLLELRILESLHIFKDKPSLNETSSAFPLSIVNK